MRTATGLDVYAYGHSIIARLDQFRAVQMMLGGGPRVVVSTAAFHARVRGSVPGLGG